MRVIILHQAVGRDAAEDEKDVLVQAASVGQSLRRLGHAVEVVPATLDLERVRRDLAAARPDCVFFLVESLGGTDSLAHLAAFLLDSMKIPYTGAPAAALVLSNNKLRAKRWMAAAGLPTPPWHEASARALPVLGERDVGRPRFPGTFIIKPVEEHASQGVTDEAVAAAGGEEELGQLVRRRSALVERPCFAEQFIDGREFNLAVLGSPGGPRVLPPAEIDFAAFPPGKPRIVGYQAKWSSGSFEYDNTPRLFIQPDAGEDASLAQRLVELAQRCWNAFELRGYARVDFRVDPAGNPWILEVNANPCLAPDAGFAAALSEAGISLDEAVQSILDDASP